VPSLASDKNGRRAILYLLIPTSTKHFIPSTLSSLASSAQLARDLGTSKKEPATRRKELVGYASAGLLEAVASHAEELVRDAGAGLLVQEVILHAQGDKSAAVEALVQPLTSPYPDPAPDVQAVDPTSSHVLDLAHSSRTYKTMLSGGHFDNKTSSVVVLDGALPAISAKAIWSAITSEESGGDNNVVRVAKGNAAFLLLETIEALVKSGKGEQVENVLGDPKVIDAVRAGGRKGAAMLADRLEKL
jgi:pumilio family protein 6